MERTSTRSLLELSATELARRVRAGALSSRAIVDAHIERIAQVNPSLNAVVWDRYAHARREADAADDAVRAGDPAADRPLHGVPCTIKECFAVQGMPQTGGLVAREGLFSARDAAAVKRLRDAGAIVMGVTNVPELCMWYETHNNVYGRTHNAYSEHHMCGGSSGGEGAIIGAGGSPFGLGSDVGGSIRMPAFFNGVFGHKGSSLLVPNDGQFPNAHGAVQRYLSTGPLARRAADLYPLVRVLSGDSPDLRDPDGVRIEDLNVYVVEDDGRTPPDDDIRDALERAASMLERQGARVRRASFKGLRDAPAIWGAALADAGGPSFSEMLGQGRKIKPLREFAKWSLGRSEHTLPALALAALERPFETSPTQRKRLLEAGATLRDSIESTLRDDAVLLYPTHPTPAPPHLVAMTRPFQFGYTAVFNILEAPVTQVPLGLNRRGLPVGVQVAAARGMDHLTLRVAGALEDAFGGWVPPWQVV